MLKQSLQVEADPIVHIRGLRKVYGTRAVLDDVSFEVHRGEIFGFLGSNGAGKTTTLEILEGLRTPGSGVVRLFGLDVHANLKTIRQRIGVCLQATRYWDLLTVRETIELFRSLYRKPLPLQELVGSFRLGPVLQTRMCQLSGGNYQRVALAVALVNDPELVFLDEPTTGLDPNARRALWAVVRELQARGRTVILTTHYMEEAQALCQRIAIISRGRIVRCGTPTDLVKSVPAENAICFTADTQFEIERLRNAPWCKGARRLEDHRYIVYCNDLHVALGRLMEWAMSTKTIILGIETRGPTLEDVFIQNAMEGDRDT